MIATYSVGGLSRRSLPRLASFGRPRNFERSNEIAPTIGRATKRVRQSDTSLNGLECAKVDVTPQTREQYGSNVELQDEFSGENQLR